MTLNDNRAPLLCYLCVLFHSHQWIQTGVTFQKHPIRFKIGNLLAHVTLKSNRWHWKTTGHLSYATWSHVHHFIAFYVNTNWSYVPETAKLGFDLCDLDLWSLNLTFCMNINNDNTWKFHDDKMKGILWERYDGRADGRTDRQTDRHDGRADWTNHRAASSQLKITVVKTRTVFDLDMDNASASYWTSGAITTILYQSRIAFL